jgi:hypothetical protein
MANSKQLARSTNLNRTVLFRLLVSFVKPQLFFCKRVYWSKSEVEPAANAVAIVALEVYFASAAVS